MPASNGTIQTYKRAASRLILSVKRISSSSQLASTTVSGSSPTAPSGAPSLSGGGGPSRRPRRACDSARRTCGHWVPPADLLRSPTGRRIVLAVAVAGRATRQQDGGDPAGDRQARGRGRIWKVALRPRARPSRKASAFLPRGKNDALARRRGTRGTTTQVRRGGASP